MPKKYDPNTGDVWEEVNGEWKITGSRPDLIQKATKPAQQPEPVERPSIEMPSMQRLLEGQAAGLYGMGRGMRDVGAGLGQLGLMAAKPTLGALPVIGKAVPSAEEFTQARMQRMAQEEQAPLAQLPEAKIGQVAGQTLPYMAGPAAPASLPARMGMGGLMGAGVGAAQFGPIEQKPQQAAMGLGGGLLAPLGLAGLERIGTKGMNILRGKMTPSVQEVTGLGKQFDVPVYSPDVLEGAKGTLAKKASMGMEEVPIIGMRGPRVAQMRAAEQSARRLVEKYEPKSGEDIGVALQKGLKGKTDIIKAIKGKKYDKVTELAVPLGQVPTNQMQNAAKGIIQRELQRPEAYQDKALIKAIQKYTESPEANFKDLQLLRSDIGKRITKLRTGEMTTKTQNEADSLMSIKRALESDMERFATDNTDELSALWRNADKYYRMKFLPTKDKQIQKWIASDQPDQIFGSFVKKDKVDLAKKFYRALDNEGRQTVRFKILDDAFENAYDANTKTFSPAKFATSIERLEGPSKVFFKGAQKQELDGFTKLMRHVERAGQAGVGPPTGVQLIPYAIAGGMYRVSPGTATAVGAGIGGLRVLFTTNAGKRMLLAASKAEPGSPQMERLANRVYMSFAQETAAQAAHPERGLSVLMPQGMNTSDLLQTGQ